MSLSSKKCCVPGCMDSGSSHRTLHLFPKPSETQRFNAWVSSIGGDILGLDNAYIYKHRRVCHAHFEEKFCCRNNRISNIAVPTLNLPGPLSLPIFTHTERRPLRPIENYSRPVPSTSSGPLSLPIFTHTERRPLRPIEDYSRPVPSTSSGLSMDVPAISAVTIESHEMMQKNIGVVSAPIIGTTTVQENLEYRKLKISITRKIKRTTATSQAEKKLYHKLLQVKAKLSKCRSKVKEQSASLKAAKNIMDNPTFLNAVEKLSSTAKILTLLQFREHKKKGKGRRFTLDEKILALSIFKQSPKCYRFLRKIFILPAARTLGKLICQADIRPGVNDKIFKQLKNIAKKMKLTDKLCTLLFDEMALKANLKYNERMDKVIGFVTDGNITRPEYADHVQVFMIRGLMKNYKKAVSYTFSASATKGSELAKQLKEIVKSLQEAGLIVVSTVCDQGTNNRQAVRLLLNETRGAYLRKGEEPKENIIIINDQEIVPLFDPPHLLKCIRKNLITKIWNISYTEILKLLNGTIFNYCTRKILVIKQ